MRGPIEGTIFLDEIGELPPQAQVRMLRVLQYKEFERVGGANPISVDITTHRRPRTGTWKRWSRTKQFREDLWFRLNVFPIRIPPLRERKEDIPALGAALRGAEITGAANWLLPLP